MQMISLLNQTALEPAPRHLSILPASLCDSLMKVISDEEMIWLSLSPVVQLLPRLSDGEQDCCADRALPALSLSLSPPPCTDLLF